MFHGVLASDKSGSPQARHAVIKLFKTSNPGPEYAREVQAFVRLHPEDWDEPEMDLDVQGSTTAGTQWGVAGGSDFPVFTESMPDECRRYTCRLLAFSRCSKAKAIHGKTYAMPALVLPTAHVDLVSLIGASGGHTMPWRVTATLGRTQAVATLWAHFRGVYNLDMKLDNVLIHFETSARRGAIEVGGDERRSPSGAGAAASAAMSASESDTSSLATLVPGRLTPISADFGHALCTPLSEAMTMPGDFMAAIGAAASKRGPPDSYKVVVGRSFGTTKWRPPEAARTGWRTSRMLDVAAVDAYALGSMMWCAHFGRWLPWADELRVAKSVGITSRDEIHRVREIVGSHPFNPLWEQLQDPARRDRFCRISPEQYEHPHLRSLINLLMAKDPEDRLTVRQALWHPALRVPVDAAAPPFTLPSLGELPVEVPLADEAGAAGASTDVTTEGGTGEGAMELAELLPLRPDSLRFPTPDSPHAPKDSVLWRELLEKRFETPRDRLGDSQRGKLRRAVEGAQTRAVSFAAAALGATPGWGSWLTGGVDARDAVSACDLAELLFSGVAATAAATLAALETNDDLTDVDLASTDSGLSGMTIGGEMAADEPLSGRPSDPSRSTEASPASLRERDSGDGAATGAGQASATTPATVTLRVLTNPPAFDQTWTLPVSTTGMEIARRLCTAMPSTLPVSAGSLRLVYNGAPMAHDMTLDVVGAVSGGLIIAFRPFEARQPDAPESVVPGATGAAPAVAEGCLSAPPPRPSTRAVSAAELQSMLRDAMAAATAAGRGGGEGSASTAAVLSAGVAPAEGASLGETWSAASSVSSSVVASMRAALAAAAGMMAFKPGSSVLDMSPKDSIRAAVAAVRLMYSLTGPGHVLLPVGGATETATSTSGDAAQASAEAAEGGTAAGAPPIIRAPSAAEVALAESVSQLEEAEAAGRVCAPAAFLAPGEGAAAARATAEEISDFVACCKEAGAAAALGRREPVPAPAAVAAVAQLAAPSAFPSILRLLPQPVREDGKPRGVFTLSSRASGACAEAHCVLEAVVPVLQAGEWRPSAPVRVGLTVSAIERTDTETVVRASAYAVAADQGAVSEEEGRVAQSVGDAVSNFLAVLDCRH